VWCVVQICVFYHFFDKYFRFFSYFKHYKINRPVLRVTQILLSRRSGRKHRRAWIIDERKHWFSTIRFLRNHTDGYGAKRICNCRKPRLKPSRITHTEHVRSHTVVGAKDGSWPYLKNT
jgi:hypothetical protein